MIEPLSDVEIDTYLNKWKIKHRIISRDEQLIKGWDTYIINLDDSSGGGTHWTAFIETKKNFIYFDSWGMEPPENVKRYVHITRNDEKHLYYNGTKVQPDTSILCGYYVLYFIYSMSHSEDPNKFLMGFQKNKDLRKNDEILKKFFKLGSVKKSQRGRGFDLVEKLNKYIPFELHATGYSYLGPNTKLEERVNNEDLHALHNSDLNDENFHQHVRTITAPINDLDMGAFRHDLDYYRGEKQLKGKALLAHKHKADHILQKEAFKAMRNSKNKWTTRGLAAMVGATMFVKRKLGFGIESIEDEIQYMKKLFENKQLKDMKPSFDKILNELK